MQQTQKYKLNLIEPSDPFLPDGLNANTQKVEDVLASTLDPMREKVDAFSANLGVKGKNCRITWGLYTGTDQYGQTHPTEIECGFYPVFLMVGYNPGALSGTDGPSLFVRDVLESKPAYHPQPQPPLYVTWTDHSVRFYSTLNYGSQHNQSGTQYFYVAIGYDKSAEQ